MRTLAIVEMVRLASRRVPRKALEPVGGVRMIDRGLRQLERLQSVSGCRAYLACWAGDRELVDAVEDSAVGWLPMTEQQSRSDDWQEYSAAFKAVDADWIVMCSTCCCPFASDAVYLAAVEYAKTADYPFDHCAESKTPVWALDGSGFRPLLEQSKPLSTIYAPRWVQPTYLVCGLAREDCGNNSRMASMSPWLPDIALRPEETLDMNTPEDLELLRLIADGMEMRQRDGAYAVAWQGYGA